MIQKYSVTSGTLFNIVMTDRCRGSTLGADVCAAEATTPQRRCTVLNTA